MQEKTNRPQSTSQPPRREFLLGAPRFLIFGAIFFAISFLGGAAAYLIRSNDGSSSTTTELPLSAVIKDDVSHLPAANPAPPPLPPPPPSLVKVDSYAATDFLPLSDWPQIPGTYGYMDVVTIGGDDSAPLASRALSNDDVLTVSGWAGHQNLGMTMAQVLFSVCDQIVGGTVVNRARPDVAKAVHPYLDHSGWRGQLAVAHLPRCDSATLRAFGLGAQGPNLWPLNQHAALNLPPKDDEKAAHFAPRKHSLDRDKRSAPKARNITVKAPILRVRTCGGSQCAVLGKVRKGIYKGYLVERREDWVLIELPKLSGWLSEKHIQIDG